MNGSFYGVYKWNRTLEDAFQGWGGRVSQMLSGHFDKRKLHFLITATALNLQQETFFFLEILYLQICRLLHQKISAVIVTLLEH